MGAYIIQVICFQALFLAVYYVLLRKETFFTYNRIYLLVAPLLSFIIPFVKITSLQTSAPVVMVTNLLPEVVIGSIATAATPEEITTSFTMPWMALYLLGCAVSLLLLGVKLRKFAAFLKYREKGNPIVEVPDSTEAFTFFNYIFIGKEIDPLSRKQILTHEKIHVTQRHTWDLVFFELLRVVLWFNPLVYVFQKQISIVHEYLADQKATAAISKKAYYEELLNTAFGTSNLSFTNTFFNKSLIKNRIIMLQKSKSKRSALIKYTLIVPLLLGMLVYVSCSEDNAVVENQSLEQQIAELKAAIEDKGELSHEEFAQLAEMNSAVVGIVDTVNGVTRSWSFTPNGEIQKTETQRIYEPDENGNMPFSVVDKVPVFPGCEGVRTNGEGKRCMSDKISKIVNKNFNTALGAELGLSGINRIFVSFKIDKNGFITNLRSRSPHPDLDVEAQRVISLLPKMQPGKQNGEAVGVLYSLPITFMIEE